MEDLNITEYERFTKILHDASGIALKPNQQYLVETRLTPLIKQLGLDGFRGLFTYCEKNLNTLQRVVELMTTNETLWFRDPNVWILLKNYILPNLIQQIDRGEKREIRIWSAASSTGQEAYSLSMMIGEVLQAQNKGMYRKRFKIIGTDISSEAVETAKAGVYDSFTINRGIDPSRLALYFTQDESTYQIKESLKENIEFKTFNLMGSFASLTKFDLILCRNVAIYFSEDTKKQLFGKIANLMNSNAFLVLGATESLFGLPTDFQQEKEGNAIYYRL